MINLINAELYQLKIRRSPKVWLLMSILMSVAMVILPYFLGTSFDSQMMIPSFLIVSTYADFATAMAPYLLLGLTITAFNTDNKHRTMVNSASIGYSRLNIYFSKLIVALIFALIFLAISFLSFAITLQIFFPTDFQLLVETLILDNFIAYLPIWLAYLSLYIAVLFVSDGAMPMIVLMTSLVMMPMILSLGSLATTIIRNIKPYVLTELRPTSEVSLFGLENAGNALAIIYLISFTLIGVILFKRKEIK